MKNILILGANGFLGKNIVNSFNNSNKKNLHILSGKHDLDLTNYKELDHYLSNKNIDSIINCAAFVGGISYGYEYPAELLDINTTMANNLFKASYKNNVRLLVNPISNCAYPGIQSLYQEENFWDGPPHESVLEYGLSKRHYVSLGYAYYKQYNFCSANIVLSNMYGPFDHFEEKRSHALGALLKKIYEAKKNNIENIEIWGTGKPVREWLYVEDAATALIKSLELKSGFYFFNIGVNFGVSILDLAKIIAKELDWEGEFKFDKSKPDGVAEKKVLGDLSKKFLDWTPKVNLEDGIKKTVKWYIESNKDNFE